MSCYDRTHGCPPVKDVDGNKLTMKGRLLFDDYLTLTCTIFNTFVFMQVFNEVNARNMEDLNVFRGLFSNHIFMAVLTFTGGAQFLIIHFAGDFAQTTRLQWQYWVISIIIGLVSFPIAFFVKFIPVPASPPLLEFILPKFCFKKPEVEPEVDGSEGGEGVEEAEAGAPPTSLHSTSSMSAVNVDLESSGQRNGQH